MRFETIKGKTLSELFKMIEERKKIQLNSRIQVKTGQPVKSHTIRAARREIAQIMTRIAQLKVEGKV